VTVTSLMISPSSLGFLYRRTFDHSCKKEFQNWWRAATLLCDACATRYFARRGNALEIPVMG
jgi:hypothetical protein